MAFEELLNKLSGRLKGIAYKLGSRSALFNEQDLFQEALTHLWLKFQAGELGDKTDSYILQGCYFHLKNYLRKSRGRNRLVSIDSLNAEEGLNIEEVLTQEDYNPQDEISQLDYQMLIDKIRNNGLTDREKQVFGFWLEGLTTREIGQRLSVSHVRVVKLQNSIKEKCQKYKN